MDYFNVFSSLSIFVTSSPPTLSDDEQPPTPLLMKPEMEQIPIEWESGGSSQSLCVIS
jgi:hypothetical protein